MSVKVIVSMQTVQSVNRIDTIQKSYVIDDRINNTCNILLNAIHG